MRKIIIGTIFIMLMVLSTVTVNAEDVNAEKHQSNRCKDSDNGADIFSAGSIKAGSLGARDTSIDDLGTVLENYCTPFDGFHYDHGVSRTIRYPSFEYAGYTIDVSEIGKDYAVFHLIKGNQDKEITINLGEVITTNTGIIIKLDNVIPETNGVAYSVANEYFRQETFLCPNGSANGACIAETQSTDTQTVEAVDVETVESISVEGADLIEVVYLKEYEPVIRYVGGAEHEFNLIEAGKGFCSIDVDQDQIDIELNEEKTINGVKIGIVDASYDDDFCGVVLSPGPDDRRFNFVDIEIYPGSQKVKKGERAVYTVSIKDNHPQIICAVNDRDYIREDCAVRVYPYDIRVRGIPYKTDFQDKVFLTAGEKRELKLVVDTSMGMFVEEAEEVVVNSAKEVAIDNIKPMAVPPTEVPEIEIHMFEVLAKGDDSKDIANAMLYVEGNVVPPPPPHDTLKIELEQGWNLAGFPARVSDIIKGEGVFKESPIFVFLKEENRYVTLEEAERILGSRMEHYMRTNGFWIYSEVQRTLVLNAGQKTMLDEISLVKGWSIVPVTYDMVNKNLESIAGNCEIERVYGWDEHNQDWKSISLSRRFGRIWLGKGIVVESGNYCSFKDNIMMPPQMPN